MPKSDLTYVQHMRVSYEIVWQTAQGDIPTLLALLKKILQSEGDSKG